jgi:hypothetical protein
MTKYRLSPLNEGQSMNCSRHCIGLRNALAVASDMATRLQDLLPPCNITVIVQNPKQIHSDVEGVIARPDGTFFAGGKEYHC